MHLFLYLTFISLLTACNAELPDNQSTQEDITTIIASAQIPESIAQEDDEPFVSTHAFTLSPTAPAPQELQKTAARGQFRQDLPEQKIAQDRFKERKKTWPTKAGKPLQNKSISEMNYQELVERKNELILEGDYTVALKYLERIIKLIENAEQVVFVMLETAELLMKLELYARAEKLFIDFIQLYPGNEFVEQSYVKAITCGWKQTGTFDRDQTKTEETLTLVARFEERKSLYAQENIATVTNIKYLCEEKLAQANMYVAKHYIGRNIFRSAHKRLDDVRQKDLCKIPAIEPELLQLEVELARAEKNKDIETLKVAELTEKYPQHEITLALGKTATA